MCNLYTTPSEEEFEQYMKQLDLVLTYDQHDEPWPIKPVGPFGRAPFVASDGDGLRMRIGQWGMIRPGSPPLKPGEKRYGTNNARAESIDVKPTFAQAWKKGQRCLVPARWYAEPNWETGKNVWWHLTRADGAPWMLAGLWSEWVNRSTGELVPNFTMITCNCDFHPLLGRLHKPERDRETGGILPIEQQDKRSLVHIEPADWRTWLHGSADEARALIRPQPAEVFDQADAIMTDRLLADMATQPASDDLFS